MKELSFVVSLFLFYYASIFMQVLKQLATSIICMTIHRMLFVEPFNFVVELEKHGKAQWNETWRPSSAFFISFMFRLI